MLLLPGAAAAQGQPSPPYRDPHLAIDARVQDLLGRMTLREKFWQLFMIPGNLDQPAQDFSSGIFGLQIVPAGSDTGRIAARAQAIQVNAIQRYFVERTRLGIPIVPFDEALHGLVREGATVFPQAIALAATWDTALVARVAGAIARESRSRGVRQVLSPVTNIASDVRWGRVEETYGEDPLLTSAMGRAYVGTVERAGIVTTPKHFIANVGEGGRDSYPIEDSERRLREYFFPPFTAAVEAGARAVMSAYNSVDGTPATQNRWLLTGQLKQAWNFGGIIISDAAATGGATVLHNTEASTASAASHALTSGLDVIFQSSYEQYFPYWDAFDRGLIPDSVIDASVSRVLHLKFALGLFESPYVDPDSAAFWNGHPEHRALALEAARAATVLLKNQRNLLPLADTLHAIAVIGTDAIEARLGGYSGTATRVVSILDGFRQRAGRLARVRYAPGPGRLSPETTGIPAAQLRTTRDGRTVAGLTGEYFDNPTLSGTPRLVRADTAVDFVWTLTPAGPEIPLDWYSVRWTGSVTATASGITRIGVAGSDGYRLYLDDRLVIDNWQKRSSGERLVALPLRAGRSYAIRLEYFETTGNGRVRLVWDAGVARTWRQQIDTAVVLARRSQVAIVVAGIEEGEFRDRAFLRLPGHQEELIQAVAQTGTPVVVVLVGGSAVTMSPWLEQVRGVVDVWYPGEAGGQAVAAVLFGDENPAGRLPITFPISEGQLPLHYNHKPTGRGDDYLDLTGAPLFPFGFGLSYTTFAYSALTITPADISPEGTAIVSCMVRNTGRRAGAEVVQLYLRDLLASVARPVLELQGFQRIHLDPGEEQEVTFTLSRQQLRMLDAQMHWVVESGEFRVLIGASSRDIRLRGLLTVRE